MIIDVVSMAMAVARSAYQWLGSIGVRGTMVLPGMTVKGHQKSKANILKIS